MPSGTTDTSVGGSTDGTTDTTMPGEATTTTLGGSGLGDPTAPSGGSNGIADTGMESLLGPGLALGALGLALRRAGRVRPA